MRTAFSSLLVVVGLAGCAVQSSTKPVEYLDERSAMTVGALQNPIEMVPSVALSAATHGIGKRISFAYLGPVEWDTAGKYGYGLWVHVASGSDWTVADIRTPATITLEMDEGNVTLVPIDSPPLGRDAYQPVATWGQTAYFELTVKMLQEMAASQKLKLAVQGADGRIVTFVPSGDTHVVLSEFIRARGLTGD
jgi:hypothetical protein